MRSSRALKRRRHLIGIAWHGLRSLFMARRFLNGSGHANKEQDSAIVKRQRTGNKSNSELLMTMIIHCGLPLLHEAGAVFFFIGRRDFSARFHRSLGGGRRNWEINFSLLSRESKRAVKKYVEKQKTTHTHRQQSVTDRRASRRLFA